jgi:CheY-like chemotaxis protein
MDHGLLTTDASVSSVVHCARMSPMTTETDRVAILVDDMFFAAKINGAAAESGRQIERVKSSEQLEGLVANPPSLVIIDLNSDRLDPLETIEFFKSREELRAVPIVSFVSHVQTELIRAAQAAGCDYVLPRSAFTQMLPQIVAGNLASIQPKG